MGGAKNCPETPRQRMIGMMYLVLTAMLALNVSAAILNGYLQVDESLHATIETTESGNKVGYERFESALAQNPEKTQEWYDKAMRVKEESDNLYNYIAEFKDAIVSLADGDKAVKGATVRQISKRDDTNVPHQYGINEGHAAELKSKIIAYREFLKDVSGNDEGVHADIENMFATDEGVNAEGKAISWEQTIFEEMPVCASITVLTKIQNDIRTYEGKVVQVLYNNTDAGDVRVNKMGAYIIPSSEYVIRGSKYRAQIILAGIDSTKSPEYYIGDEKINDNGIYEVIASGSGEKRYHGKIAYQHLGETVYLPFEGKYIVGEPTATISNTDLNIMYRGYNNPFSISVPGVPSEKLQVRCPGAAISKQNGLWVIKPAANSGDKLTIEVLADIDGKTTVMGSHAYRVKNLPKPDAYFEVNGQLAEDTKIARQALINPSNKIVASYGADGLIQAKFSIVGFQVKLPTGASFNIKGDKLDAKSLEAIKKLKQGNMVNIQYIKAVGPDGKEIQLRGLPIELN
jgi:gliding motility-associated protein GldM